MALWAGSLDRQNTYGQPIGRPVEIEVPRPSPGRGIFLGQYCRLEPLTRAHAPALFEAFAEDAPGFTYLPEEPFVRQEDCAAFCETAEGREDPLLFAICDPGGRALGHASYLRIQPASASIEVGYIHFSPAMKGSRIATEAMFLMMAHAFDDLGYRRYEWKCDALNAPSRAAAQRLGFQFEGIFRQATITKGRNRDTAWFSILDHEWPALKSEFTRWLDPGNFDANGVQRSRLVMPRA